MGTYQRLERCTGKLVRTVLRGGRTSNGLPLPDAIAAMQRHLDAGHKKLPLVIPVLFYTGKRSPYPYSTNWLQEFDDPALAGKLYTGNFPLVDVTVIPDEEIMGHRSMAALTLLQKHIRQRDLAELTDRLSAILLAGYLSEPPRFCGRVFSPGIQAAIALFPTEA